MKIYKEESLSNFEFWSGAIETAEMLTYDELQQVEAILDDEYPDGIDETELNDIFRFEEDTIADWLGFYDWEELCRDHNGEEDEEEENDEDEDEDEDEEEE